jgi:uncharacterized protein (TIGR03084 family)
MSALDDVLADLRAETERLDGWVAGLDDAGWATVTTDEGWTVAHQIAHLHWTDTVSVLAATDPEGFGALLRDAAAAPDGYVDAQADRLAQVLPAQLLGQWREGRDAIAQALAQVPTGQKVPWFGPPMSPTSMATARFMETWAHGHDVAQALGIRPEPTARVKHVCHIGVRARGFAYMVRGLRDPGVDIRVELVSPDGDLLTWGPENAADRVEGLAHDFALLATRRRHRDDVDVTAHGPAADQWLDIIQAFAGLPGNDPKRLADR